jgi:hypothetical protein
MTTKINSGAFLIDQKTSDILHLALYHALHPEDPEHFSMILLEKGLVKKAQEIFLSLSEIRHEKGWCDDPDCQVPQLLAKRDKRDKKEKNG